jgi:hypothetical protein
MHLAEVGRPALGSRQIVGGSSTSAKLHPLLRIRLRQPLTPSTARQQQIALRCRSCSYSILQTYWPFRFDLTRESVLRTTLTW